MKICAIICELNPFHNGHRYLIERARELSGCDKVLCVMSGNFTQRGEAAILDKFTRAKHAVLGGADAVIELPVPFAVAPAEIFARGATKIINSIPDVSSIAFGCESGDAKAIENAAEILRNEDENFKHALAEGLDRGDSYTKSICSALKVCGGDETLLEKPNNVLAVEYIKSLKNLGFKGEFYAVKRVGAGHGDTDIKGCYTSSSAIRNNLSGDYSAAIPDFVKRDLSEAKNLEEKLHEAERLCVLRDDKSDIARVYGVSEGLENKIKELATHPYEKIIKQATSRRYPSSRVERALAANLLKLYRDDCEIYLDSPLYIKPLAVRGGEILSALGKSAYPLAVRGREAENLCPAAKKFMQSEIFADQIYAYLSGKRQEYFTMLKK